MSYPIHIKLTRAGHKVGPFNIYDQHGHLLAENVSKERLIAGIIVMVEDDITMISLESIGPCFGKKLKFLKDITEDEYFESEFVETFNACLWRHLTDVVHYNFFYGLIEPYVIEYPYSSNYLDTIVQNIQDYTKVYEYTKDPLGVFTDVYKTQPDNKWFNKAVLYNDQQSTGILSLEPKPLNNLQAYNAYPRYEDDSKVITYTKTDNFYQYNTFWNIAKDSQKFMFLPSCDSLSIDKIVNQENMDYTQRSFNKATLRAKDLKVRHILDNSSTTHLVSQFIINFNQNSYK